MNLGLTTASQNTPHHTHGGKNCNQCTSELAQQNRRERTEESELQLLRMRSTHKFVWRIPCCTYLSGIFL